MVSLRPKRHRTAAEQQPSAAAATATKKTRGGKPPPPPPHLLDLGDDMIERVLRHAGLASLAAAREACSSLRRVGTRASLLPHLRLPAVFATRSHFERALVKLAEANHPQAQFRLGMARLYAPRTEELIEASFKGDGR